MSGLQYVPVDVQQVTLFQAFSDMCSEWCVLSVVCKSKTSGLGSVGNFLSSLILARLQTVQEMAAAL